MTAYEPRLDTDKDTATDTVNDTDRDIDNDRDIDTGRAETTVGSHPARRKDDRLAGDGFETNRRSTAELVVSVGTDHHRFDRLIDWIDDWRDLHPEVVAVVQAGASAPSRHGDSREMIAHAELLELFRRAAVVVSHGGPSTVMDARMATRLPIVVPRDPAHGEHVDHHQMRFGAHLLRHEMALVVHDREALFAAIDRVFADPAAFTVAAESSTAVGVIGFGAAVDRLLGTSTPVVSAPAVARSPLNPQWRSVPSPRSRDRRRPNP